MLGREGVSGLYGLGFVDAALNSPDPDEHHVRVKSSGRRGLPRLYVSTQSSSYDSFKRLIDISAALLLLLSLSPVLVLIALAVKGTSRGPVIFCQNRLTQGGRVFRMYKFRTMGENAEALSGPVWAQEEDPRVTPIGRILRASRADELPQLFNVLQGEMSLIGPRPERPEMAEALAEEFPGFNKRLAVRGGITGLAQVSAGYAANLQTYRQKLSFDLTYIQKRSLLLDLFIAWRTLWVIFSGDGAR